MYRTQVKDIQVGDFVKFVSVKKSTGGVIFRVTEVQPPVAATMKAATAKHEYYDYNLNRRVKQGETVKQEVFLDKNGKKLPKTAAQGYVRIVPALEVFPAPGYSVPKAGMLVSQSDMNSWKTKLEVVSTIELLTTFQTYQRFINTYVTHVNQSFETENKSDTTDS